MSTRKFGILLLAKPSFANKRTARSMQDTYTMATIQAKGDNKVIGHLPREISCVAFFCSTHAGRIFGTVTNR